MAAQNHAIDLLAVRKLLKSLLAPERTFINVVLVYGLAISLLTLAVPIAVQSLINTVANIGSPQALASLVALLLLTLLLSGYFSAVRTRVMEHYERHVYARLVGLISIRMLLAKHEFFDSRRNIEVTQRYFDIMTLQKNIPPLLVDGFALVLQTLVGFTLVSFYHPALFMLNIVMVILIYLIWLIWGRGAMKTAILLSHAKYDGAKWLSEIAVAHEFFKSKTHIDYVRQRTEDVTANYVNHHRRHFRYTFTQTIMFLALYAVASSALLGIGGYLVIQGELSIGQLVASELILTAIFFGLSKFSKYLKLYYDIFAAADELGIALGVPQEVLNANSTELVEAGDLEFSDVEIRHHKQCMRLNFNIEKNSTVYVSTQVVWVQRAIIQLLKRHAKPLSGWIRMAGHDLQDYDVHQLRQAIVVVDRSPIISCSIAEYFRMIDPDCSYSRIFDVLTLVGLEGTIAELPDGLGLETQLSPLGSPLMPTEFLLLKLAGALIADPCMIVLTQYFDMMPREDLSRLMKMLKEQPCTVLYFSHSPYDDAVDFCLLLDSKCQEIIE